MNWRTVTVIAILFTITLASAQALTFRFESGDSHFLSKEAKWAYIYDLGTKYRCVRQSGASSDGLVMFYMHFPETLSSDVKFQIKFSQYNGAFIEVYASSSAPSVYGLPTVKSLVYTSSGLGDVTDYSATFTVTKGSGEYLYFAITLPYYKSNAEFYLYKDGYYWIETEPEPQPTIQITNLAGIAAAVTVVAFLAYLVGRIT